MPAEYPTLITRCDTGDGQSLPSFGASEDAPPPPPRSQSLVPTEISAEEIVAKRAGDVLLRHTILKSDHFPGCQNTKLLPLVDGAPNFRQVPGLPVYGVAIPTVAGVRHVLDLLGATKGRRKVIWINLREEPVLYVNGRPFVVREADKPFANLEYTGIDRQRVEDMETRLKADVLAEAEEHGGMVLVAHEDDSFQVVEDWEAVTEVDVQTPADVYEELSKDGYEVAYLRVPVTDEKAPKGDDFESLMCRCWTPPEGAAMVFNCQMGRGRTTTGMAIGCLLHLKRMKNPLAPPPTVPIDGFPMWWHLPAEVAEMLPLSPGGGGAGRDASASLEADGELKAGFFSAIRSLLRALERGREAKLALDLVLDACSAMQNLREAIASYRGRLFYESNDMQRQSLLHVCVEYLDRYYVLVTFAAYLDDPAFNPGSPGHVSFADWWAARPELQGILGRLVRANPLAALSLDRKHGSDGAVGAGGAEGSNKGPSFGQSADTDAAEREEKEHEDLLARRNGSVLGPRTILKLDHFPGCQSSRVPMLVSGAPNFRGTPGNEIRVFGGAIATVEGVRRVLEYVQVGPESEGHSGAVWHMMREEPVVYISGQPYVLREESRPFKNLLEYRGIDAQRLDLMEQRLRDDIIAEASANAGTLLVTRETSEGAEGRSLRQVFIPLSNPSDVETPRQVFQALKEEGYRVTFLRVPLTDGTCPRPSDFDAFYSAAAAAGPGDALIYTCQLGGGRTTTGMAIGTLLRLHLNGAQLPLPSDMERKETMNRLDEDVGGASPRGSSDDEDGYAPQGPFAETPFSRSTSILAHHTSPLVPDLDSQNLVEGEYVGTRRFVRTLEQGPEAKVEVDDVVDACGVLINLRTSIMRYRKPKSLDKFFRPELHARHSAFQRGSAYLERYCMLIAFAVYLKQCRQRGRRMTFEEWVAARPDVQAAREAIHQNPAGALAPVPSVPQLTPGPSGAFAAPGATPVPSTVGRDVPLKEQRIVLMRRKGNTVGRRSILKSFSLGKNALGGRASPYPIGRGAAPAHLLVEGVADVRASRDVPVYAVGSATVEGLRRLLGALGAQPGGPTHVVITDLREELVLYVNGTAYTRRELEMPAAALHHAGIQAAKLEDLERRLRADMLSEAAVWGGKVLLHREVESTVLPGVTTPAPAPAAAAAAASAAASTLPAIPEPIALPVLSVPSSVQNDSDSDKNKDTNRNGSGEGAFLRRVTSTKELAPGVEDITRTTEYQPTTHVTAFWEQAGDVSDIDSGMCTPSEVFVGIAAEGYQISYRRVPMSRERTPQAADLDHLALQMTNHPGGRNVAHLFVSRTAIGSSARFATAFACTSMHAQDGQNPVAAAAERRGASQADEDLLLDAVSPNTKRLRTSTSGILRHDSEPELNRSAGAGEYRGVMNLCRVLPGGAEAKQAVDDAIDACSGIGNLREDILRCKIAAEDDDGDLDASDAAAARRLGLHYLQRYFFLIAFRAFLDSTMGRGPAGVCFSEWVAQRKEITYLLSTLELE